MVRLVLLLKNGKVVKSSKVPLMQAIEWRERLRSNERERIRLVTDNGVVPMEGCWLKSYALDGEIFTTDEAASAMYLSPYTIYECNGEKYQYSLIGKGFEKAKRQKEYHVWSLSALPEGTWRKLGKDVL